jgi:hypothetical protein
MTSVSNLPFLDECFPLLNIFDNDAANEGFSATIKATFITALLHHSFNRNDFVPLRPLTSLTFNPFNPFNAFNRLQPLAIQYLAGNMAAVAAVRSRSQWFCHLYAAEEPPIQNGHRQRREHYRKEGMLSYHWPMRIPPPTSSSLE